VLQSGMTLRGCTGWSTVWFDLGRPGDLSQPGLTGFAWNMLAVLRPWCCWTYSAWQSEAAVNTRTWDCVKWFYSSCFFCCRDMFTAWVASRQTTKVEWQHPLQSSFIPRYATAPWLCTYSCYCVYYYNVV